MKHVIDLTYEAAPVAASQAAGASRPTDGGEYGAANYTVKPSKEVAKLLKKGDTLEFTSNRGFITVKLKPEGMFTPEIFSTDPFYCKQNTKIECRAPVTVIKEPGKEGFKYCCGFSMGFPNNEMLGVLDIGP